MTDLSHAQDASEDLRRALDPEVAGSDLMPFAVHRAAEVRAAVAARPDCPIAALTSLGFDHDRAVLEALLKNPRTPSSVVRKLADHRDPRVSDQAVQRLRNTFR